MELSRYIKIGLRWWWLILVSVGLSAVASYLYSENLPRIYAARTTLMVGASITESPNPNELDIDLSRTLAAVYGELVLRRPITTAVIDRLGLEMGPDQLSSMIKTNVILNANLLEIFVLDVHPQRAQLLANAIGEELIRQTPGGGGEQQERDAFIQAQLQVLQVKIQDTDQKIADLGQTLDTLTSAVEIAEAQSKLNQLELLKASYQDSYNQFLSNLSKSSPNQLRVFEPASEPTSPISPNVPMNIALAAAAGLALAVVTIILLEFVNDTLTWDRGEVESVMGLPVLGAVSSVSGNAGSLLAFDKLWSPEVNALRSLRDSIYLQAGGKSIETLLITSATPGEGKSFIATNLAAAVAAPGTNISAVIASRGSIVILVDADLRKPSLHEIHDMPNLLGLADILALPPAAAEKMLEKALRPTKIDNLFLLPAGRTPVDPGSLLNSPNFLNLLNALKARSDLVVIDSGPVLDVVETRAIAHAVDASVLVLTHGQSRRRVVQRAINYLKGDRFGHLLGAVFNRVQLPGYAVLDSYGPGTIPVRTGPPNRRKSFLKKLWPFGRAESAEAARLNMVEVADYLGVSQDTAQRWCEQGRIPAVKTGRHWTVRLEDLNQFVSVYQASQANAVDQVEEVPLGADSSTSNGKDGAKVSPLGD